MSTTGHGEPFGVGPSFDAQEISRRVEDLIQYGTVEEADYEAGKVRIRIGDPGTDRSILTDWLPWSTARAGFNRHWVAPEIGEQVLLVSQSGNMAQGLILGTINKTEFKHAGLSPEVERKVWRLNPDLYVCLFHDVNRLTATDYRYVPDEGSFRQEVGAVFDAGSSIIQTKDSIELRVGTTKLVLSPQGISMHVLGQTTELKLLPGYIEAHVQHLGVITVAPGEVRASVQGMSQVLVTPVMVEASTQGLGLARITPVEIRLELPAQQVAAVLRNGAFKAMAQTALVEVAAPQVTILGGLSGLILGPSTTLISPSFSGVQATAPLSLYSASTAAPVVVPPPAVPPISIPRPPVVDGNPPTYPG